MKPLPGPNCGNPLSIPDTESLLLWLALLLPKYTATCQTSRLMAETAGVYPDPSTAHKRSFDQSTQCCGLYTVKAGMLYQSLDLETLGECMGTYSYGQGPHSCLLDIPEGTA